MTVSKAKALEIIRQHGWLPTDPTATLNGEWCDDSTFYLEVGDRDAYTISELRDWLGY